MKTNKIRRRGSRCYLMAMRTFALTGCFLVLLLSTAQAAETESDAVLRVVQKFYSWYVPVKPEGKMRDMNSVLKDRASSLTNELRRSLKQDAEAQARKPDEIVGLDFDPFLASQDPCERYEAGKATRKGTSYWVEVYAVCAGTRHNKPDVIAELVPQAGSWVFANFHYPTEQPDLLRVLKQLRAQRSKPGR